MKPSGKSEFDSNVMDDIINEIKSNSIHDLDYAALLRNKRKMDQTGTKVGGLNAQLENSD